MFLQAGDRAGTVTYTEEKGRNGCAVLDVDHGQQTWQVAFSSTRETQPEIRGVMMSALGVQQPLQPLVTPHLLSQPPALEGAVAATAGTTRDCVPWESI